MLLVVCFCDSTSWLSTSNMEETCRAIYGAQNFAFFAFKGGLGFVSDLSLWAFRVPNLCPRWAEKYANFKILLIPKSHLMTCGPKDKAELRGRAPWGFWQLQQLQLSWRSASGGFGYFKAFRGSSYLVVSIDDSRCSRWERYQTSDIRWG